VIIDSAPKPWTSCDRAHVQCIQGNHETGFFGGRNPDYLRKCQREFGPEMLDFLASAPLSLELEAAGAKSAHGPCQPVGAI